MTTSSAYSSRIYQQYGLFQPVAKAGGCVFVVYLGLIGYLSTTDHRRESALEHGAVVPDNLTFTVLSAHRTFFTPKGS